MKPVDSVVRFVGSVAALLLLGAGSASAETLAAPPATPPAETAPAPEMTEAPSPAKAEEKIQTEVVFCIDCSGSMSGSLSRAQLAMVGLVNEMQAATPDAPIRVGVIRYGTGDNALEVDPLTEDRRAYGNYLSKLKISGGAEFVGTFIQRAVEQMKWSKNTKGNVIRRIVMVGNETAFQGPVDYRRAAQVACSRGFSVSAVYCPTADDERGAEIARATATTRVAIKGVIQPTVGKRAMLDVENTWILTAYFGGGEVMKLSTDPSHPLLRYSPEQVAELVEVIIPQQEAQMAQADAAFSGLDMTGRFGGVVRRGTTTARGGVIRR